MARLMPTRPAAAAVALVLVVAAAVVLWPRDDTRTVTAHFSRAVSIFKGSEVRVLGVPIGEVTAVVPEGDSVRVDMSYDAQYSIPADAKDVIVTPTLVADRFVQLTPAWNGGPRMKDGGDIPLRRTAVPVELDRIYSSLDQLSNALGPSGANADGSLDRLLSAGAEALGGEGVRGHRMLVHLSKAVATFGDGSGELFSTVRQLEAFVVALARNDRFVSEFISNLAGVSRQLSGQRGELRAALANLADAVGRVEEFVRHNKHLVESDVDALTDVSSTLAQEKQSLATVLEKGPLGAGNLAIAFDNSTGAIGARVQTSPNTEDVDGFLCAIVQNSGIRDADTACKVFSKLFKPLSRRPPSSGSSGLPRPVSGRTTRVIQDDGRATTLRDLLGAR